ncbi:SDR family oxidoreductase [Camelimonas abortus]|uniref:SDR family oxidoreductase n=1 Tax=Camelimonas abortus TaxID=1017184 RepID=A0ABV7LBR1_9HYPH
MNSRQTRAALVTGGAKRIGAAIALALARDGHAVAIHCNRSVAEAEALAARIAAGGGRAAVVRADLENAAETCRLVDDAVAALGGLSLLVNSASLFEADEITALDLALWERQFAVNLRAPAILSSAFARALPPGSEGAIINILDQRVWKPTPRNFSYTLTKSALYTATRTMAQALAPAIRVNAVGPGPVLASGRQTPDDFAAQVASLPLAREIAPEEIADAVLWLAKARNVTGQMIAVDGGQHLAWRTPDALVRE